MHLVLLTESAKRVFEAAQKPLQQKLDRCFKTLSVDPRRHNNVKALKGRFAGYFRFRVGDYRVIYRIDQMKSQIIVVDIAHRRDIYE